MNFADYAPVGKAEAAAAAAMPPAPSPAIAAPPVTATAPAALATAAPAKAAPRFVGGALRSYEVPLRFPVEYDGVTYEAIPLRRPSAAEVGDYFQRLASIGPDDFLHFPIYAWADGTPVPGEVIDFLDPDDAEAVQEAAADFLCARLRRLQAVVRESSIPPAGDSTGPTSST